MTLSQKMTVRKTKTIKRSVFMKAKIGGSWCGAPYIRYEYELLCDTDSYTVEVILSKWLNAATLRVVCDTILGDSVVIYERLSNCVSTTCSPSSSYRFGYLL